MLLFFLRNEWKPLCVLFSIIIVFFCGCRFEALRIEAQQSKDIRRQVNNNNAIASDYEAVITGIEAERDNLNEILKVTYAEDSNHCPIPSGGMRALQQATR
jgi:hypothetical protein